MPVAVNAPQRKDPLENLARILSIGQSAMGIKSDYEQSKLRDLQLKKMRDEDAANERRSQNIYTPDEASTLLKVPDDSTDPDAVSATEKIETVDENGQKQQLLKPFKFIPESRIKNKRDYENLIEASDERKGIFTPKRVTEMGWVLSDKSNPQAQEIQLKLYKDDKPFFKRAFVAPPSKSAVPSTEIDFKHANALSQKALQYTNMFEKDAKPTAEALKEIEENQQLIDAAKRGEIEWGQVEGLLATKIAGRAQKGVLTDKDFERASFTPSSILGKSQYQIQQWAGDQSDKIKALEWLNNANKKAYQRQHNNVITRQKILLDGFNKRNAKFGTIPYAEVAPESAAMAKGMNQSKEDAANDFLGE